jgi:hypothetical protein
MFRRLAVVLAFASGCAAQVDSEDGQAVAQITNVPSQVACIRINVKSVSRTVERKFSVSAGQSATLMMSGLPTGEVTFVGDAFSQLCGSVTASTAPSWSSDPTTLWLSAGAMSTVGLKFQRTGNVTVTVDFVEDAGGGPSDLGPYPSPWPGYDGGVSDLSGPRPSPWPTYDGGASDLSGPYPSPWPSYDGGTGPVGDLAWKPNADLN